MKRSHRLFFSLLSLLCVAPYVYLLAGSLVDETGSLSLLGYYQVFLASPKYLARFWVSAAMCLCIAVGQTLFSVMAGYALAKCPLRGRRVILYGLTVLMTLPVQISLVPNYMILGKLGILNTYWALILPAVFVPLGTFLMTRAFRAVPDSVLDAARLDGCGTWRLLTKIACPISRNGIWCTFLLSFLDGWNMVEQPVIYLSSFQDYPLSVALGFMPADNAAVRLTCCILSAIPPVLLFVLLNRELAEGIAAGGEK